ncbi:Predicted transcriptional regulator [Mycobacteroides abscessus subsp. abscessus]|nr:XRE family transcriptional regulator [Mycobacteroides abscessus]SHY18712.1 Predicted transcriptional regulator [Mycobacteroides abscessus subsp. abscessus]CPS17988.1 Predicted transcriptional regulator [Mycobacteroides abscessus]CPS49637.1 Predicted transcriptional regulator [Mycobacteroides abscessus]CPT30667.1 Predicted transcriptional regulator [Mycobacteroides abscessus]
MYETATISGHIIHTGHMDVPDLGQRLRDARAAAGVSAKSMADTLGLDPSVYSRTELGKRGLRAEELVLAARRLDMTVDELVTPGGDTAAEALRDAMLAYGNASIAVFNLAVALDRLAQHGPIDIERVQAPTYSLYLKADRGAQLHRNLQTLLGRALTIIEPGSDTQDDA